MRFCDRRLTLVLLGGALAWGGAVTPVAADITRITGKVLFEGDPAKYKRTTVDTSTDPKCKESKKRIGSERVVLNKTKRVTVRNVLVSIKSGLGDLAFPIPQTPVTLTHLGCQYFPHVIGIVQGQPLKILNGDDTLHRIRSLPKINEAFNFTQPKKDLEKGIEVKLVAEEPFKVKCDVHPWMECYIGVFKHLFLSVTGSDGTFELKGMPGGRYVIQAWHEEFGTLTAVVNVATGETATYDFTFAPD
ncbi:MAG: carboxypeptidase regulatory-like domain-containing protein [Planctomycetota bacterium]|jgi:hypothetical protein